MKQKRKKLKQYKKTSGSKNTSRILSNRNIVNRCIVRERRIWRYVLESARALTGGLEIVIRATPSLPTSIVSPIFPITEWITTERLFFLAGGEEERTDAK